MRDTHLPPTQTELDQYLAGEALPLLAAHVRQWVEADGRRSALAEAVKTLDCTPDTAANGASDTASARLADRWASVAGEIFDTQTQGRARQVLRTPGTRGLPGMVRQGRGSSRPWWVGMVATAVVVAGAALTGIGGLGRSSSMPRASVAHAVYQTSAGERGVITLPDIGTITLAPATSMTVTSEGVSLSGQAWFALRPRAGRPFTVRTTSAAVRVLGTSFLVRQYAHERASRVVVSEGKVSISRDSTAAPIVLTARMLGVTTDSGIALMRNVPVADYADWTHGRLVFRQVPLHQVIAELERAYDAEIRVADTLLVGQRVTITAHVGRQTLTQVLDLLAPAVDAHCARAGRAYVIAPGRANMRAPRKAVPPLPETQYGR
jgi:transmembrane sensor